jgi:hypothetical protein
LLAEQLEVKERVNRALRSVTVVEVKAEERVPQQVAQLEEVIQQLQQCIADLELHAVPETPQDVRDQREATAQSTVDRLKSLALECKQLSNHSAQTYEKLTENPELQALESQAPGSEATHRHTTGVAESPVSCRQNEEVSRETHSPTTDPYDPEKSYGSNSMAPTCAR